jgi:hypothetical protein
LALWAVLLLGRNLANGKERRFDLASITFGFVLSLAMFSKIQVFPVTVALLILGFGVVLSSGASRTRGETDRRLRTGLILGVGVAVITPWWALGRPEFVTETYVSSIGYFDRLVYGSLVESFVPLVAGVLGLSLAGTVAALLINRRHEGSRIAGRWAEIFSFVHLVELGAIAGVYVVVAPASRSFPSYAANTHHLVYGVIANTFGNVFGSGFLHHKTVDGNTVARIFDAHALGDRLLGVNVSWLIVLVGLVAVARILAPKTADRGGYGFVLLALGLGVVMDVVFTLRWYAQFNYYAIFSLVFYGIGMALFLKLEWQNPWIEGGWRRVTYGVAVLLFGLLVSNVGFRTFELMTAPPTTGISDQIPTPMLESTKAQNPHFWIMFEESP